MCPGNSQRLYTGQSAKSAQRPHHGLPGVRESLGPWPTSLKRRARTDKLTFELGNSYQVLRTVYTAPHIQRLSHLPISSHRVREDVRVVQAHECESEVASTTIVVGITTSFDPVSGHILLACGGYGCPQDIGGVDPSSSVVDRASPGLRSPERHLGRSRSAAPASY